MTAKITDIRTYRARTQPSQLEDWSTDRLTKRMRMLQTIENGHPELTEGPLAAMSFPDGYDPDTHPGENLFTVSEELVRRGVLVPSA